MLLCFLCVEFIVVTATVVIVQWYCVVGVEFIVVTPRVDIVQWYGFACGIYCGYSNSRYSAIVFFGECVIFCG